MRDKTDTYTQARYFYCKETNVVYRIVNNFDIQN